ncbi:diaminopimelate epimerase [Thermodesulfovibrio sp.]|jgi:diaminopimelate epimerase|uniref:diaminopimelate epimerase n=1 Tax=Thermodesulfovibrio sp. TaxID=2067987 RepID=UPI00261F9810|nr:diaminopimelate epimerase [Thermodesulfovibrio sp.]
MEKIYFTKMHGLGNDFILIDCINQSLSKPEKFAIQYCDRRFGIGADQLLLLYSSERADFKMRIFNADGSEVEMCGNGIRCFAKYIWDRGLSNKDILEVETLAGIIKPKKIGELVQVDMGKPEFTPSKIPVDADGDRAFDILLEVSGWLAKVNCVSMGNPHAVIFLEEDPKNFAVAKYGPIIETHPIFPKRTNVEFAFVKNSSEIVMRVWERGAGETLACGTGACATAVASMVKGLTNRKVTVHLLGGDLLIEWAENGHVYMTGPAEEVFEGTVKVPQRDL